MKASATVLCNNILMRGKRDRIKITPMKLQKLMYYVCRDYVLAANATPISEQFEVWQYGPVLPSIYEEFKAFHSTPIEKYAADALGRSRIVSEADNPVLSSVLNSVWSRYKHKSGIELSNMTHQRNSGWYRAYMDNRDTISEEDMRNDTTR